MKLTISIYIHETVAGTYLDEELVVECAGGGVEGRSSDVSINLILCRYGVSGKQVHELNGGESGISHASEDLVNTIGGLRDEAVGGGTRVVGAASHELETRTTKTVGGSDGTGEVDAVNQASRERL